MRDKIINSPQDLQRVLVMGGGSPTNLLLIDFLCFGTYKAERICVGLESRSSYGSFMLRPTMVKARGLGRGRSVPSEDVDTIWRS